MKTRHKVMLITLILFTIILYCINDLKKVKELTCTVNSEFQEMASVITLKAQVKNNDLRKINISIDVNIPEEYANEKQMMISSVNAEGKMQATATDKGMRLTTGIESEFFKAYGLTTDSSYTELKEVLEFQGYTCK